MGGVKLILRAAGTALAVVLYAWVAGVRNVPEVRRRKARRRLERVRQASPLGPGD